MPPCEGGYKNFRIGDLFEIYSPKKRFNANNIKLDGGYRYVARGSSNNGIKGYTTQDTQYLCKAKTISFGQDTATIYYQSEPYFTGDKIKVLELKNHELEERIACYLITVMRKSFSLFAWGQTSFNEQILNKVQITLPTTSRGDIDFAFMESRIRELEEERMRELEAYLAAAGFANCDLTPEEQGALRKFNDQQVNFKQYTIGDLFEKLANNTKHKFNKRNDVSSEKSATFNIPLVNAKHGDNGIMFYGKDSVFLSTAMTIDIVQNGAVATGDVYAQPQPTGVLWDAYLIKNKVYNDTESTLLYFATSISKSIKPKYCYDKKATWERVQKDLISLPTTPDGKIDYAFMETYISAIKKQTIAALKDFIAREHTAYEQVINA